MEEEVDGYPNFKRHGKHAILPKYLTRDIYDQLKHRQTTSGVTLNHIIATGVSLPLGAAPPRGGFGIFAGDAESYRVFAPLFIPLLEDHHGIQLSRKQPPPPPSPTTTNTGSTSTVHVPALEHFLYQRSDASSSSSSRNTRTTDTTAPRPPTVVASKHTRSLSANANNNNNDDATPPTTTTSSDSPPSSKLSRLKRQVTNLNPEFVLSQSLDPSGQYILYTRMRLSRSIEGFAFSPTISREKRRELERLLQSCMDDWKPNHNNNKGDGGSKSREDNRSSRTSSTSTTNSFDDDDDDDDDDTGRSTTDPGRRSNKEWLALSAQGKYSSILDMSNAEHDDLIQRHVLFEDPDDYSIAAGIGRDWPDARGVYYDKWESPEVMIWYNAEDHVRIISLRKGGDLLGVFTRLSLAVSALQTSLKQRGYSFAMDPQLGFLNTSPANVGTALRASVFVKLVRLGQQPGFRDLIHRLRLEATTRYDDPDSATTRTRRSAATSATTATTTHKQRYTGIFDIANAERLGKSEVQLINTMIHGVGRLIELEKRLERGEKVDLSQIQK
jgi:ATP:guanido phosphotransferase, C-terminal catalytic domain/ATP:guanido phosphotransferase, N-terminal domain